MTDLSSECRRACRTACTTAPWIHAEEPRPASAGCPTMVAASPSAVRLPASRLRPWSPARSIGDLGSGRSAGAPAITCAGVHHM